MKQFEPKQVTIGGNVFYIFPFPAFKASNLSGELAALAIPLLGSLAPFLGVKKPDGSETSLLDIDVEDAAPAIAGAFNSISGDKVESLMKKLLITGKNITVELEDGEEPQRLTEDLANELFCGEVQNMFILAFEVIRVNFAGFFRKLGGQSGAVVEKFMKQMK
ncbi:phage tail assembly chaperone [Calorimonas adulescens]|jgi:hypothetical protein|uniref:Uncharacterized protein n=1 Tax=Calorimonas adulescens TaxID=2606906 RepID=A0A5D8QG58_9THEO|nr:hypothetical protein [Calorimonas adulescens]TZE83535.1 hypothetical protein FWJ32_01245 [Calorimonas adulescens]